VTVQVGDEFGQDAVFLCHVLGGLRLGCAVFGHVAGSVWLKICHVGRTRWRVEGVDIIVTAILNAPADWTWTALMISIGDRTFSHVKPARRLSGLGLGLGPVPSRLLPFGRIHQLSNKSSYAALYS